MQRELELFTAPLMMDEVADFIAAVRTAFPLAMQRLRTAEAEVARLVSAITEHHAQKADDRCIEDDDRLYAAAGLPPCDRRVGNKAEMLANCERFIDRRCEGGHWPSYRDMEAEVAQLRADVRAAEIRGVKAGLEAAIKQCTRLFVIIGNSGGDYPVDARTVGLLCKSNYAPLTPPAYCQHLYRPNRRQNTRNL